MPVVERRHKTSDECSCCRASRILRLSNGEGAAILPARTMKNPAGSGGWKGSSRATNGKKPPSQGARVGLRRDFGQQNQTGIPGVWRTGNSFTQTDPGHPSGLLPLQQRFLRRLNLFPRSQFLPRRRRRTSSEREQLFGGAAFAIFAGVDVAAGQLAPAPLVGRWRPSPADRATFSDAGHADYRRLRQQSGADTAVSETTDELQKGPENQVMRPRRRRSTQERSGAKAQAPTAKRLRGPLIGASPAH